MPRLIIELRSRAASALRRLASALQGIVAARKALEQAPADRRKAPWKRRLRRWAWRIAMAASTLLGLGLLTFAALLWHYGQDLPRTSELKNHRPPEVTRILARDGTPLAELFVERRTVVPISAVPRSVVLAVLAAEDASFYQHEGLNYLGILRALLVNLRSAQARQGGSTITQQVIKNVLLTPERTFARKIRELILARRIEQELTKDEILELYLNQIYFGHGRYGVEEAARYYFGKSVKDVQLAEAALLAGLVKGPSLYSPRVDLARAGERRSYVLQQLRDKGFASRADVEAAARQPIVLAPPPETAAELAPEVVTEVERVLAAAAGPHASRGGYTVTTTIDPRLQAAARAAVRGNLDAYAARRGLVAPLKRGKGDPAPFQGTPAQGSERVYNGVVTKADDAAGTLTVRVGTVEGVVKLEKAARYNPRKLPPSQFAEIGKVVRVTFAGGDPRGGRLELALGPQGALVALDVRTAEVLAVVGGYDAVRGALNRARSARRQPASTFKPIVYSYGIHARAFTAASILETQPAALRGQYRPDNYDESDGRAPRRLREALANSVNVAAVWTLEQLGPAKVVAWARSLGITSKLGADLSLALGAYEVTPFEMAAAFNTFAAGGTYREPVLVRSIVGPGGEPVPLPGAAPARRVMDEAEAYIVTSLLRSVVESGTAKRALSMSTPVAGKTGTSNAAKDAWFVGYSTDIACAAWTGHDDASPLGPGETGGATSLPAFIAFMQEAHKGRPRTDFAAPPDGLVRVSIDPATGQLALPGAAGAIEEVFLAGTEPTAYAELPSGGEAPGFVWPF